MCEVALGTSRVMVQAFNVVDIPNAAQQSVHATGLYYPKKYVRIDNVAVASEGFLVNPTQVRLFYNEFIVYRPSQVKIKYLFKMKFHFQIPP